MKHYELFCVLPGTLAEDELPPIVESIKEVVASNGGTEVSVENRGKSRLAYPMKHIRYGYSYLVTFQSETENIPTIQAKLRLNTVLLRSLISVYDPEKQAAMRDAISKVQDTKKTQTRKPAEEKKVAPKASEKKVEEKKETEAPSTEKVAIQDIDKKLDEILDKTLENV
jgi:small subunit ribosomal protein S6